MDIENKIREFVRDLSWKQEKEKQETAIDFLSSMNEKYYYLIFDKNQKETWENAIAVIEKIGYPKNARLFPNLFWLLQDVNWPSAMKAFDILSQSDKDIVKPLLEESIKQAYELNDTMWMGGLNMLVKKMGYSIDDFLDKSVFSLLKIADF